MGAYLSTPILTKNTTSGKADPTSANAGRQPFPDLIWAACDMQGWRKSMEDDHITTMDIKPPKGMENTVSASDRPSAGRPSRDRDVDETSPKPGAFRLEALEQVP